MARVEFVRVDFREIDALVRRHLDELPSRIDSFLEGHILRSSHYRIQMNDYPVGFGSIHDLTLLTQFHLTDGFKQHGQTVFAQLRELESVNSAFVPTCDEY